MNTPLSCLITRKPRNTSSESKKKKKEKRNMKKKKERNGKKEKKEPGPIAPTRQEVGQNKIIKVKGGEERRGGNILYKTTRNSHPLR